MSGSIYFLDLWALIKFKQRNLLMNDVAAANLVFSNLRYNIFFDEETAIRDQLQFEEDLKTPQIEESTN